MQSEGNTPKNGEPTVSLSFITMLQHTSQFWSKISFSKEHFGQRFLLAKNNVTTQKHPQPSLIWLQLIFTCSLHRNQHLKGQCFCDASDVIMNATEQPKRLS
jgi:hypothetical protein